MLKIIVVAIALLIATTVTASAQEPTLKFKAPAGWVEEKSGSTMRVAQYKLPKEASDTEDASLVVYYFGQSGGGGIAANLDRWIGQMKQPDGSDSKDKAKQESLTINGLKVTTVELAGTYTAETAPGSGEFYNKPNYHLRAAVIETPKGFYYLKEVGPEKTVAKWNGSVTEFLKSVELK
ncbi:MAG TPA: hypothetical protein VI306_23605 [Pyrinomonadaceae bacterium]